MRAQLFKPDAEALETYLAPLRETAYTYGEVGASRGQFPAGYAGHANRFLLGDGDECWAQAKTAIATWQPFNTDWARIHPEKSPLQAGQAVSVSFRVYGVWWKNACRIVYTVDEPSAYGFAYGTLPGHVGRGEEYFGVERDEAGQSWFVLKAFSQPDFWLVRFFPFLLRQQQQRFIRAAANAMQKGTARK